MEGRGLGEGGGEWSGFFLATLVALHFIPVSE